MEFGDLHFLVEYKEVSMPSIEDVFDTQLDKSDLKDKFRPDGTSRARHMKGMTGINRSTGQNLIPDIHKVDQESNNKVDLLLQKQTGRFILDGNDIKGIVHRYRVTDLTPVEPKQLGNTGITIYYDRNLQKYCIKK